MILIFPETLTLIVMAYLSLFLLALSIIFLTISLSGFSLVQAEKISFTSELIHRDSPNSPFFNASETYATRLAKAVQRSADRASQLSSLLSNSITAAEFSAAIVNGDFLMRISIGRPPTELLVNVATGSDLVWIPCLSLRSCTQNCNLRFFDSTKSSTYENVPCDSYRCRITTGTACQISNCVLSCNSRYPESCPDGNVAMDTLTLNSTTGQAFMFPNTGFVCGNLIAGDYPGIGMLGLGRGSLSLLSRINHLIDGKFAHCIVPYSSEQTSKIRFGEKAAVSGNGMFSTPLITNRGLQSYNLNIYGMSVGNESVVTGGYGSYDYLNGLGIDSGTMFTSFPNFIYSEIESRVRYAMQQEPLNQDPTRRLRLCYRYTPEFNPPIIRMFLQGGIVELSGYNSFIRMGEDTICLAFAISDSDHDAVLGYWQMTNFLIGYDLDESYLSFKKTDCTKY
ncbi:aspartic proteinase CDR1-like [Mercurialis annua]|uniref:aspartic proteinase CDR1-like n=1 Tax=Mercurialis annua TaxID=3986 RepID=UPI00215E220B|nr:aspartic proteinase CDR1-like [Mercurialis annua]